MTTSATDDEAQAALLLARLQSQFGDLDVNNLFEHPSDSCVPASSATTTVNNNNNSNNVDDKKAILVNNDSDDNITTSKYDDETAKASSSDNDQDDEDGVGGTAVDSDSDDDIVEPTAEELAQWQNAQYAAAAGLQQQQDGKTLDNNNNNEEGEEGKSDAGIINIIGIDNQTETTDEWIIVNETPSLGQHESAFFASSVSAANDNNNNKEEEDDRLLLTLHKETDGVLGGKWQPLYRSNVDGRSYISLIQGLRKYDGPTVLFVGAVPPDNSGDDDNMTIIGYYTQTQWSESTTPYGNERCFLFRINTTTTTTTSSSSSSSSDEEQQQKLVQIFYPLETKSEGGGGGGNTKNFQFMSRPSLGSNNKKNGWSNRGNSTVPPGLGAGGGGSSFPRLHITESLDKCTALPYDKVFESGPLLPEELFSANYGTGIHFDADIVEVWAVGGEERIAAALAKQKKAQNYDEWQRQRNAKVDKTAFLEDFQSGLMDGGKLFEHREQARGRHDFEVDEDEEGNKRTGGYRLSSVKRSDSQHEPSRTIPGTGL